MRLWLTQYVISPYRLPLFTRLAGTDGVDFRVVLLSKKNKTRPEWRTDLRTLPFPVKVPYGVAIKTSHEGQLVLNPFFLFTLLGARPDVVICGGYNLATVWTYLYSLLTGGRYVIWTEATKYTDGAISGARRSLRQRLIRRASAIIHAGTLAEEYVRSLTPELPRERFFLAYNCVENRVFAQDAAPALEDRFPPRTLLFIGKLNERKGVPDLLSVYRQLVAGDHPELGLVLVGDGPLRPEVEAFRQEHKLTNLFLEGWVPNDRTVSYFRRASAFVLLSKFDANPLVLFEALAAGVPIVCSNRAGNAIDFIQDGVNGYIVDPDFPDVVRSRLAEVVSWTPERRLQARQRSQQLVQKANYDDAARAFVAACRFSMGARVLTAPEEDR